MAARIAIILILIFSTLTVHAQSEIENTIEVEILDALNGWRVSEGLWPLRTNDTLTALALAQAEYLTTLPELPEGGDLHIGRSGETPDVRAQEAPFNWPPYGNADRAEVGEVAAIGGSSGFAVNYWQNSDIHSRTIRNPVYREVGVAVVAREDTYLIVVVLGARANVLPVTRFDGLLYLSNERSDYAVEDGWIQDATRVRLFDADGRPLAEDWQPWTLTLPVPDNAGDRLFVLYSDGRNEAMSEVALAAAPVVVAAAPTDTPTPTTTPPAAEAEATIITAEPQPTATDSATATESPTATATPQPDLLLVYPGASLTIVNTSGGPLDLTGFSLESNISLPFTQWLRVSDFPLDALPDGHCVQVRPTTQTGEVEMAGGCGWVRSLINVQPDRVFWRITDFTVQANGQTLATCSVAAGQCAVSIGS